MSRPSSLSTGNASSIGPFSLDLSFCFSGGGTNGSGSCGCGSGGSTIIGPGGGGTTIAAGARATAAGSAPNGGPPIGTDSAIKAGALCVVSSTISCGCVFKQLWQIVVKQSWLTPVFALAKDQPRILSGRSIFNLQVDAAVGLAADGFDAHTAYGSFLLFE